MRKKNYKGKKKEEIQLEFCISGSSDFSYKRYTSIACAVYTTYLMMLELGSIIINSATNLIVLRLD